MGWSIDPKNFASTRAYVVCMLSIACVWLAFLLLHQRISLRTQRTLIDLFISSSGYFGGGALAARLERSGLKKLTAFLIALAYIGGIVFACDRIASSVPNGNYFAVGAFVLLQIPAIFLKTKAPPEAIAAVE